MGEDIIERIKDSIKEAEYYHESEEILESYRHSFRNLLYQLEELNNAIFEANKKYMRIFNDEHFFD